ncbi:hypothetical protein, partial [Companilactobacillus sp.]|uniref:hypothetical protein n=1 Tax=Companilactobacillus sp. TaxID=2767905 RepID=UPI0026292230
TNSNPFKNKSHIPSFNIKRDFDITLFRRRGGIAFGPSRDIPVSNAKQCLVEGAASRLATKSGGSKWALYVPEPIKQSHPGVGPHTTYKVV